MNTDSILLPLIPLRGITIFPNMIIHFDVGREKSISALEESMLKDSKIFLVSQIDPEIEDPKRNEIYSIGTICKIKQILKLPKGVTRVLVEGVERAAIIDLIDDKKFKEVIVEKIDDENNIVTLTWDKLNIKDVTYSVYIKDNKNGENGFILYENSLQENYISIPIKEDFNIDVYVIGSKDGKFSKQSNIINVKI